MAETQRVSDLKDAIANAVATLDEADGSRVGMAEAIDSARETLSDAYGRGFEKAVSEYLSDDSDDEEDEDNEDEEDEG